MTYHVGKYSRVSRQAWCLVYVPAYVYSYTHLDEQNTPETDTRNNT